jgi:hypothetical protein
MTAIAPLSLWLSNQHNAAILIFAFCLLPFAFGPKVGGFLPCGGSAAGLPRAGAFGADDHFSPGVED